MHTRMSLFQSAPEFVDVGTARMAYRRCGSGDPLVLVHGWPLNGKTYRKVLPTLSERFTCYVPDLLGAGETAWTRRTDFSFRGQATALKAFVDRLGLSSYSILAHDTGATISRQLTLIDAARVKRLALINTEMPFHRPSWVVPFQVMSHMPGSNATFRALLSSRSYRRAPIGLGNVFLDRSLLDGEFHELFIAPEIALRDRMEGQIRYLQGIDWKLVDEMSTLHATIEAPVVLIWGEEDRVFPIERARAMVSQFKQRAELIPIPKAALLPHEEQPQKVLEAVLPFLTKVG